MKINIELKDLKEVYNLSKGDLNITADNNGLRVISINKDVIIMKDTKGSVIEKGSILIDGEIINNIKFKNEDVVINENTLKVKNRKFTFTEEEAKIKENNIGEKIAILSADDYKKILTLEYAISKDEVRPILQNVYVDHENFVALDGYRMGIRKHSITFTTDINEFFIPLKMFKLMKKIKVNEKSNIEVYKNNLMVTIKIDNLYLSAISEEGRYIEYKSVIPCEHKIETVIDPIQVLEVLKSYDKNSKLVKLDIKNDSMIMSTSNEKFSLDDEIKVNSNDKILIGFNPIYLKDALSNYKEKITLNFNNDVSPVTIKAGDYFELLLPVKFSR